MKLKELNPDPTINLALDTINIGKQALVFANTKASAEKTAEDIAKTIKTEDKKLNKLSNTILHVLSSPTKQCRRLAESIKKGIAFHHAGLTHKQKELIEDNFRDGLIKIICCTPTLSYGLDLPAFRAIMKDLRRYGIRGLQWIPTLEYLQMAGRAGRPRFDKYGEAIAIAKTDATKKEIQERYIKGEPEEIFSKLAVEPVLRTYLLSLIATEFVNDKKSIIEFFAKTFWAFQYQDMHELEMKIMKMLKLLEDFEFVEVSEKTSTCQKSAISEHIKSSEKDEFKSAANIYNEGYKATLIGKRVAELYLDPLTANYLIECVKTAASKKINEFSFLQAISHTLEIRPLLNVRIKESDDIEEALIKNSDFLLEEEPEIYDHNYEDFLKSIKTGLFFQEWINEKDDEYLLEKYNIRPGEIRAKIAIADWLLYSASELTRMLNLKDLLKELMKIRFRVKYGVKQELLVLLKLKNIGKVRARKLYKNGIKDIRAVKKTNLAALTTLLGKKTALNIKEQVGQKVKIP